MGSGRGKRDKVVVSCCCGWCSGKQGHADVSSFLQQGPVPSYHLRARGQLAAAMTLCLLAHSQMGGAWTSAALLVALDTQQPPSLPPLFRRSRVPSGAQPCLCLQPHPYLKPLSIQNSCSGCRELNPADSRIQGALVLQAQSHEASE